MIIVNGCQVEYALTHISYEEVVDLAGLAGTPLVTYYSRRDGEVRRTGTMGSGCSPLLLTDVMAFDVAHINAGPRDAGILEFSRILSAFVYKLGIADEDLADAFAASRPTIQRWKSGENAPHPAMRGVVYAWLIDQALKRP